MDIYYATTNQGKIISLTRELAPLGVRVVPAPLELVEPRSDDVEHIAETKVRLAFRKLGQPVVALDAGFYIPSLNGFPRAFVNFALETIGLAGILKLVSGRDRSCEFRECLAYVGPPQIEPQSFVAHIQGSLALEPRGCRRPYHWSELALVFIPHGYERTLGEMDREEYELWAKTSENKESAGHLFAHWLKEKLRK